MKKKATWMFVLCLLLLLSSAWGIAALYYLAVTTDYTYEVYLFMGFQILLWIFAGFLIIFSIKMIHDAMYDDWLLKNGKLYVAQVVGTRQERRRVLHEYDTFGRKYNQYKEIIIFYTTVKLEDGSYFEIKGEARKRIKSDLVLIRTDGEAAVFDKKVTKYVISKNLSDLKIKSYIDNVNNNLKPKPRFKESPTKSKKFLIVFWIFIGIINVLDFVIPTIIINSQHETKIITYTEWNNEIKTKSKNFLGYELPKYDFGGSSSYYVTEAKRRVYDSSHNTYQQYSYADEFSFHVLTNIIDSSELSGYANMLKKDYGFTIDYDSTNLEFYTSIDKAITETDYYGKFHYIRLSKGNCYIVMTSSYRDGYYNYDGLAAELSKDVWFTIIKKN